MSFIVGQTIRLDVTFRNPAQVLTDPASVTLTLQLPDNSQTVYTYGGPGTVVRDSLGKYHQDITLAQTGEYRFRWDGEGGISAIEEGAFQSAPTVLVPQPPSPAPTPPEFTYANLLALDAAIAGGTSRVKFADREVEYSSMKDLMMARELILDYLGQATAPERRQIRIFTNSGW